MPDQVRNLLDNAHAVSASHDLQIMFKAMRDRIGQVATLAAIEHAVGTYCDGISKRHAMFMGAAIAGVDPAKIAKMLDRKARGLIV